MDEEADVLATARAEILAVERQWTTAHLQGDFATIAQLMADDYIRIQPDGSVSGKAAVLAAYQPDRRHWDHAEGDEYDIRIYGDLSSAAPAAATAAATAVVVGRWTARGVNNGQPFDYAARFLSVYVRRDGRWQMVAEQSTDIR
jgi:ketosteroid isomerase-like protein